LVTQNFKVLS